jgi:RHS repeat-associated protein
VTVDGAETGSWTYDAASNRRVAGREAATRYDAQDRLLADDAAVYTYAADGTLATRTRTGDASPTRYTYASQGNLLTVGLPDGRQVGYVVDAFGRRVGKYVDGQLAQGFLWQGGLRVAAELDAKGAVVSRFVYASHVNVPDLLVRADGTYRLVTDALGSPLLVVNVDTGLVAQQLSYDEWGNVTSDSNPGFQPFGFAGGLYDRDTRLVRFGKRDYDAATGRWTSKDSVGFEGGLNWYEYCTSDPVNCVDPSGLDGVSVGTLIPTYGNWGGPGWSGGQRVGDAWPVSPSPPIDADDACYMAHDYCYIEADARSITCSGTGPTITRCDAEVIGCVARLGFRPGVDPRYMWYRPLAGFLFALKLAYDVGASAVDPLSGMFVDLEAGLRNATYGD